MLGIFSLTRALYNTGKWVFWGRGVQNRAFKNFWGKTHHFPMVLSQANVSITFFDQSFAQYREVGVSQWHGQTDRHIHGHRNSMTESAHWADSVKIEEKRAI